MVTCDTLLEYFRRGHRLAGGTGGYLPRCGRAHGAAEGEADPEPT